MALDLSKAKVDLGSDAGGAALDLSKAAGKTVTRVKIVLNWDPSTTSGPKKDPDVVAFLCGQDGNVLPGPAAGTDRDIFPYFVRALEATKNLVSPDGVCEHSGDDRSGGKGEVLVVNATKWTNSALASIRVSVTIFHAKLRKHNFGKIKNLRITVIDADTDEVIVTGELSFDNSTDTAMNAMDVFLRGNGLFVQYIGEGYSEDVVNGHYGGLRGLCNDHGVPIRSSNYDDATAEDPGYDPNDE